MNIRILSALLRKEVKIMRHNPLMVRVVIMLPLMVMLVMPLIATMDVKNVGVAVVDLDHSQLSRRIAADMGAVEALDVIYDGESREVAMTLLEKGECDVIMTIPYGFSKTLKNLDAEANGVNATKGLLGAQYAVSSAVSTVRRWIGEERIEMEGEEMSVINRYNPTLNYRNYMVPALMVVLIIVICGFLPALNLVREKETGTLDAMNVTPVSRFGFVFSKLVVFWGVALLVVTIGMVVGRLVYGLSPLGSIGAIYFATLLFSLVMSGLGVTIANKSSTMMQTIFVMFAVIMIFQLMGGLFTPISSMPEWARDFTYLVPPRYFIEIMRSIYLKGAGMQELWMPFTLLGGFALLTCALAAITYRKQS